MLKHSVSVFVGLLGLFSSASAQINNLIDEEAYKAQVKFVSEFFNRFNGREFHPGIDSKDPEKYTQNLRYLFDIDFISSNRETNQKRALSFIDSVVENRVSIHFEDPSWFAKAKCHAILKGHEVDFDIILTVESRGLEMYKWVITDVEGSEFLLTPSTCSRDIFILPNEHESNFMKLHELTKGKDDYISLYSSVQHPVDPLSVFNTLVYYGLLEIEYVYDIEFHFLQVPGYIFIIKEKERDSFNSGWLITELSEATSGDKTQILEKLYPLEYRKSGFETNPQQIANLTETKIPDIETAKEKIEGFFRTINQFIQQPEKLNSNPNLLTSSYPKQFEEFVKGRYSFTIHDKISKLIAEKYELKSENDCKLDILLSWLSLPDSGVESVNVSNLHFFNDEKINPRYRDKFLLLKGIINTEGEKKISEEAVFFIYNDQIAGIKEISECY
ncbi:MAG: hypothetical protein J1D77_03235 [Muribaculaceae bacterium]|nr:hypothetical protein [Muribaculaceae bacterium]